MERCLLKGEHKAKGETDVVGIFKRMDTQAWSKVDRALLPTCKWGWYLLPLEPDSSNPATWGINYIKFSVCQIQILFPFLFFEF